MVIMEKYNCLRDLIIQANNLITDNDISSTLNNSLVHNTNLQKENTRLEKLVTDLGEENKKLKQEINKKQDEYDSLTKVSYYSLLNKQLIEKDKQIQNLELQIDKLKISNQKLNNNLTDLNNIGEINKIIQTNESDNKDNIIQITSSKKPKQIIENDEEIIEQVDVLLESVEKIINEPEDFNFKKKNKKTKQDNESEPMPNISHMEETVFLSGSESTKKKKSKKIKQTEESDTALYTNSQSVEFDPESFKEIKGYELITYKSQYLLNHVETKQIYSIHNNEPNEKIGYINSKGKIKFDKYI